MNVRSIQHMPQVWHWYNKRNELHLIDAFEDETEQGRRIDEAWRLAVIGERRRAA